MTYKQQRRKLD